MNKIIEQLAQKEYELFVVNTKQLLCRVEMEIIMQNISRSHHFCYKICYRKKDHWAVISRNTERTGYVGFVLILTVTRKKIRIFRSYTVYV